MKRTSEDILAEIDRAYRDLENDARNHGGIGQGYIEDSIASLWREYDRARWEGR